MPFTASQLDHIISSALDLHLDRGRVFAQDRVQKPLLKKFAKGNLKSFPSGKGSITQRVKWGRTFPIQGYTHDEMVGFQTAANIKTADYPWKELHQGLEITETQLAMDGISVVDGNNGGGKTVMHAGREDTALANMLDEAFDDMGEDWDNDFNLMLWGDGVSDPSLVPGVTSIIVDDPAAGLVVAGIDQAANVPWRNRAILGIAANLGNSDDQILTKTMSREFKRELVKFGGSPDCALAGSDFMDQLENEVRAKGVYTQTGWASSNTIDMSAADPAFKNVHVEYDPTLDELGFPKRCYVLSSKDFALRPMEGEDMKKRSPVRPHNQYAFFRAVTWKGGFTCRRRNGSGVYSIA